MKSATSAREILSVTVLLSTAKPCLYEPVCSRKEAIEMLWTMISINNWEQLTIECGWSAEQYIDRMKTLLKRILINKTELEK